MLDGWSLSLLLDEVLRRHAAVSATLSAGQPPDAPDASPAPAPSRYADWIEQAEVAQAEPYWRAALAGYTGAAEWTLAEPAFPGRGFMQQDLDLGAHTALALVRQAAHHRVTPATLVQAAWALLVGRYTGSSDVIFGVVTSGREIALPGIESMVGLFVTTLPLRVSIASDGQSLGAWLSSVQRRAATVREHEAVPLAQIVKWCELDPGRTLFESLLVMSNYPALNTDGEGPLRIEPAEFRTVPAYALSLIVAPGPVRQLRLVYDSQRFDAATIAPLAQYCVELLRHLADGLDPRTQR